MKKIILALIVLALIGVGVWQNIALQKATTPGIAEVNGRLNLNRLDIATLYAGRVDEILVNEGDEVQQGQSLVRLSTSQIDTQILQIKAKQQQARDAVARISAEQEAAQQQFKLAQLELNNAQKLRKDNLISTTELARFQTQYAATLAKVNAIKASAAEIQSGIEQADAQLAQVQDMYDDFTIKAPIQGRIEYKIAEPGTVIPAGGKVMSLLDPSDVYLNIFLPSHQSNPLKIGDEARIKIEGIDAIFPASIQFIAAEAQFTPKSVETQEERSKLMFKVKLVVPKEIAQQYTGLFKGGMTALGYVKYDSQAAWADSLNIALPPR
ncbi:MAG: HlyD family efflux transporter periplasmic adaptor subunit [Pelistega sp.]|nr:HlyD family efflux transporter periplasmic adaptor subunit [Pelistega sp.]